MELITTDKPVLDMTCGARMMWFDKGNQLCMFTDIRTETHVLCDGRTLEIKPDLEADFTNLPIANEQFWLVVFDPSHFKKLGQSSWMAKKYGVLPPDWKTLIRDGFNEAMRVLKPNGTLIFKWNEGQIPVKEVIEAVGKTPLFGHTSGRHGKTIWMTFMKLENGGNCPNPIHYSDTCKCK